MKKETIDSIRAFGASFGMASGVCFDAKTATVALFHPEGGSLGIQQKGEMFQVLYMPRAEVNAKRFCELSGARAVGLGYEAYEHGINGLKDGLRAALEQYEMGRIKNA